MDSTQVWVAIIGTIGTLAAGLGTAIKLTATWLAPRMDEVRIEHINLIKTINEKIREDQEVSKKNTASITILSQFFLAHQELLSTGRVLVLLIEDSLIHQRIMRQAVTDVSNEQSSLKNLPVRIVENLSDAYRWVITARIIVLDVGLSDVTVEEVKAFVRLCKACPIVIYTAMDDMTLEDFPGAMTLVNKSEPITALKEAIKNATMLCGIHG